MTPQYAGADWLESTLRHERPELVISPFGRVVADFLGELFAGIYHMDVQALRRADWTHQDFIVVNIGYQSMATFDDDKLTRLVFLAHHLAIRVSIKSEKRRIRSISLTFSQRERTGDLYFRHPTLDQAVADFKKHVSLPEYGVEKCSQ